MEQPNLSRSEKRKLFMRTVLRMGNHILDQMDASEDGGDGQSGMQVINGIIRVFEGIEADYIQAEERLGNRTHSTQSQNTVPKGSTSQNAHGQEEDTISDSESNASFQSAQSEFTSDTAAVPEILALLVERGCEDMSSFIIKSGLSNTRRGAFGYIHKARLLDGTEVAITTPITGAESGKNGKGSLQKAAREVHTWIKCRHPNVLPLLGVAIFCGKVAMVSPWMTNGTLQEYIRKNPNANRCDLSTQVCNGLAYMHDNQTVHGDLKAINVMVSESGVAMIGDFGHGFLGECTLPITATSHSDLGTLRWTAPEIIKQEAGRSYPGDVYSLGMTILEVIGGEVPYGGIDDFQLYAMIVHREELPPRPESYIPFGLFGNMLWSLLESCWSRSPQERPSAMEVRDVMKMFSPDNLK